MRTAEQGHTKECLARTLICVIENIRDENDMTDTHFELIIGRTNLVEIALDYYDGLIDCICPDQTERHCMDCHVNYTPLLNYRDIHVALGHMTEQV